jgi:hypothetical protein
MDVTVWRNRSIRYSETLSIGSVEAVHAAGQRCIELHQIHAPCAVTMRPQVRSSRRRTINLGHDVWVALNDDERLPRNWGATIPHRLSGATWCMARARSCWHLGAGFARAYALADVPPDEELQPRPDEVRLPDLKIDLEPWPQDDPLVAERNRLFTAVKSAVENWLYVAERTTDVRTARAGDAVRSAVSAYKTAAEETVRRGSNGTVREGMSYLAERVVVWARGHSDVLALCPELAQPTGDERRQMLDKLTHSNHPEVAQNLVTSEV